MVCLPGLTQPEAGMCSCIYLEWYVFLDSLSPKQACVVVCTWNGMSFWTHSARSRHGQVSVPGMVCLSGPTQPKADMCSCLYLEWYVFLDSLSPKQACVGVFTRNGMSFWTHSARSRHVQLSVPGMVCLPGLIQPEAGMCRCICQRLHPGKGSLFLTDFSKVWVCRANNDFSTQFKMHGFVFCLFDWGVVGGGGRGADLEVLAGLCPLVCTLCMHVQVQQSEWPGQCISAQDEWLICQISMLHCQFANMYIYTHM